MEQAVDTWDNFEQHRGLRLALPQRLLAGRCWIADRIDKTRPAQSLEACLARHGPALVLFARRWAACRSDAEDIVQDAFVRFWQRRAHIRDSASYLFACVRTVALNRLRAERRRRSREQAATAGGETWFEGPQEHHQRREVIEKALKALPPQQHEVVVLKVWGELTFGAIAQVLGISPDTAASRYRYGLAALRRAVDKEEAP